MGKRKPFIDKSNALSYQVVHRSQRDPAIADESAPKRVLKPVPTSLNMLKKGKGLEVPDDDYDFEEVSDYEEGDEDELDFENAEEVEEEEEEDWTDDENADEEEEEEEEEEKAEKVVAEKLQVKPKTKGMEPSKPAADDATNYGIFFKDQDTYDYVKHLKPIGVDPSAVFVSAAAASKKPPKAGIRFLDDDASVAMSEAPKRKVTFDLPSGVLGSQYEDEVGMLNREAHVSVMDIEPSMREIIYALDDEAYVEEDLDDFFDALNADTVPEKYAAAAEPTGEDDDEEEDEDQSEGAWYQQYQRYKENEVGSDDGFSDEEDDKDRLTMMSMTSSVLFRNKNLTVLDERFDELLRKEYNEDEDEDDMEDPDELGPESQKRIDKIFDSFLNTTEVVGRKKLLLNKVFPMKQMDNVRKELKGDEKELGVLLETAKVPTLEGEELYEQLEIEYQELMKSDDKEKWDVETVLSTYSNIYNRPSIIKEIRKTAPRIRMRKGVPYVQEVVEESKAKEEEAEKDTNSEGDEEEEEGERRNAGEARRKGETKEERKARKAAVKSEKKERRMEKKAVKTAFAKEIGRQKKTAMSQAGEKAIPL
ncbi:hypothetical protein BC829DRAFT_260772 [Chytridium lagenaria]|nr:hypothetical protein BC829DRAFT_260772 [Chytridium lagenaria]